MSVQTYYHEPFFSFSDINRLFDNTFATFDWPSRTSGSSNDNEGAVERSGYKPFRPKIDIHENTENNLVTAIFELPGLKKEDVNIDLQQNCLIISGETSFSNENTENGYVVKERRRGKFSRTLPLPSGTKPEDIKAAMENGVLTVTFPKTTAAEGARRITIA